MSDTLNAEEAEVARLLAQVEQITNDITVRRRVQKLRRRLHLPMVLVMDRIAGNSVIEKANTLGVTRQTVYQWLDGTSRPRPKMAKRLEKLTGFPADDIRGRDF